MLLTQRIRICLFLLKFSKFEIFAPFWTPYKAPIKTSLSLIANFQVIKTAHEGIVQTLINKVNPKSVLPNLNLASFEVI